MSFPVCAPIKSVIPDSPAYYAGFYPGCFIVSVNGNAINDILDWRWHTYGEEIVIGYLSPKNGKAGCEIASVDKDAGSQNPYGDIPLYTTHKKLDISNYESGEVVLYRDIDEDWGFEFDGAIYDRIRQCKNKCSFCFIDQLPSDVRGSLNVKDDDYRLSFLQGNFVTLTNLRDSDVKKIIEMNISPLRFSLHAISADVRLDMIGPVAHKGLEVACKLMDNGIELHVQIVLMPGVNDGDELQKTIDWAYAHPQIQNVGIVPLGYTKHQQEFIESFNSAASSLKVVNCILPFANKAIAERGHAWVFAADEFYANAHGNKLLANLPKSDMYGNYEMFEDGIGIIRSFVDDWQASSQVICELNALLENANERIALVAGEAQRDFLLPLIQQSDLNDRLVPILVKNDYFGGNVNVTGLLCAVDILSALKKLENVQISRVYLPKVIFNSDGLTLDDYSLEMMQAQTKFKISVVSCMASEYLAEMIECQLDVIEKS